MRGCRRLELIQHSPFPWDASLFPFPTAKTLALNPSFLPSLSSIDDDLDFTLDLLNPVPKPIPALLDFPSSAFDAFDTITDLIHVEKTPFYTSTRRVQHRVDLFGLSTELYLQSLCDRVSALELSFDRLAPEHKSKSKIGERKYTWTAEIKDPEEVGVDRKYKWTTEIKEGKKKGHLEKNYKYTAEIKGKGEDSPFSRKYTFTASTGDAGESSGLKSSSSHKEKQEEVEKKNVKREKEKNKSVGSTRLVEIEDHRSDHGALVLRQV